MHKFTTAIEQKFFRLIIKTNKMNQQHPLRTKKLHYNQLFRSTASYKGTLVLMSR